MGEYTGYLSPGASSPHPVYHVTAMTYRDEPILPVVAAGEPIEENHTCWGLIVSAQILWELRQQGFPITMCFCPFESAAHWLVVTVDRSARSRYTSREFIQALGEALFGSRSGSFIPKVIVLEDDVDATDLKEVVWAFATRCHPVRGQHLFPDRPVLPLVAFLDADERRQARVVKVIYSGLPSSDRPTVQTPRRSSFRHLWPREIQERVLRRWTEYGYGEA
jgi:4-hydroxy-3-polyprenylbenzoate decarboxylase